jgi:hypothetical protein
MEAKKLCAQQGMVQPMLKTPSEVKDVMEQLKLKGYCKITFK